MNIIKSISNNKTILSNFTYLTVLQIFNICLPLLTYPYLLRVIGLEKYGIILFANAIVAYPSLIINFGFNITGAKNIAYHISRKEKVSEIVSCIYINKFILWLFCLFSYTLILVLIPLSRTEFIIYFFSYFLTFNEFLFPSWFFQAIEKMRYITLINITARLLFVALIFIVIREKSDFIWVPVLNASGAFIGGVIALYVVFIKEKVTFYFPGFSSLQLLFKEAFPIFISGLSVQVYLYMNKLIIGSFLGMSEVTVYDIGEKIANILRTPISMISQATFPKISRERRIGFINKVMYVSTSIVFLIYVVTFICAPWIVYLLAGSKIQEAETAIRILAFSTVFASLNMYLGSNRLIAFGYGKLFSKISIGGCLFFLVCILVLWLTGFISYITVSFNLVAVEIFVFLLFLYYDKKLKILHE